MVRAGEQEQQEGYKAKLFNFRGIFEGTGRHTKSLSVDIATSLEPTEDGAASSRSQGSRPLNDLEKIPKAKVMSKEEIAVKEAKDKLMQEMEQMKERFAKLLLGEDMSGGGKGVSSALALSNAFTNLAASIYGEQKRLEPMPAERKAKWKKEIDWLLSVTDYVVEMVPSQQKSKDGTNMEIMTTRQRTDLHMNIPALRKLDAMLIECLDNFKDQNEFYYVSKDSEDSDQDSAKKKNDDKWWLPTPKVPPEGLSDGARKFLQYQKDCVNQVLKAAMAINAQILTEMEIPESYIDSLPKNGRASLGDSIYRSITVEFFDPDQFLSTMDLSSEHKILDLKNRIEASIVIWKRKMNQKDSKSAWGSAVSLEKRELFEERAETILLLLKHRFPGLPQSSLDISKIQYNRDVGQAVLESYSRILESLAFTVLSRIDDVLQADFQIQSQNLQGRRMSSVSRPSPREETDKGSAEAPGAMTLSDFMGWGADPGDSEMKKQESFAVTDEFFKDDDDPKQQKLPAVVTNKKGSYLENLGVMRSPTSRH
ncbi:rop guanine nucleotide exchange factor 12 [Cajanus cajan]|uniref:rop guanine nucleotide exchange factor 12 n=1 Tax=Cajanus cajan TaxID=3821 RepID=UPI00098D7BBD|nr:rop guanine nucleotide exchange factor 12 [Cajanus cajan]